MSEGSVPCVSFILVREGRFLVERRRADKALEPGALTIPGGHVEAGEDPPAALVRELREELDVAPLRWNWLARQVHVCAEVQEIDYFVVEDWEGRIRALEAASVEWIRLDEYDRLDLAADRRALEALLEERCGTNRAATVSSTE